MILEFFFSGPVCWRKGTLSYGRGAGTVPSRRCPSHRPDENGGLCYKKCRSGYDNYGCCICYKGWSMYGRGVGILPGLHCPSHRPVLDGGLCYENCRSDYYGVSSDFEVVFKACSDFKYILPVELAVQFQWLTILLRGAVNSACFAFYIIGYLLSMLNASFWRRSASAYTGQRRWHVRKSLLHEWVL